MEQHVPQPDVKVSTMLKTLLLECFKNLMPKKACLSAKLMPHTVCNRYLAAEWAAAGFSCGCGGWC